jgi:hypothetical protein
MSDEKPKRPGPKWLTPEVNEQKRSHTQPRAAKTSDELVPQPSGPGPKWLTDEHGNNERAKRSRVHETRVAKAFGGRRIAQSGSKRWSKWDKTTDQGDISTPIFHLEHKRTDNASMSLKKEWLDKVSDGAKRVGKDPGIVLTFEDPVKRKIEDWVLVPLAVAQRRLGFGDGEADEG